MRGWRLAAAVAMLAFGCARNDGRTPHESVQLKVRTAVQGGVKHGRRAANSAGPFALEIRHNPTTCGCPRYEVFVQGAWRRAFIEGDAAQRKLATLDDDEPLAVIVLRGEFTEHREIAENGVRYPVFVAE